VTRRPHKDDTGSWPAIDLARGGTDWITRIIGIIILSVFLVLAVTVEAQSAERGGYQCRITSYHSSTRPDIAGSGSAVRTRTGTGYTDPGAVAEPSSTGRTGMPCTGKLKPICGRYTPVTILLASTRITFSPETRSQTTKTWLGRAEGAGRAQSYLRLTCKRYGGGTSAVLYGRSISAGSSGSVKSGLAKSRGKWTSATATFYGPGGFYGKRTACGQTYTTRIRGTAHMSLPCGAKLTVCRYVGRKGLRRCLRITVIDRGAFHPNNLDLSARTAQDLCRCAKPYTTPVMYRRGWKH